MSKTMPRAGKGTRSWDHLLIPEGVKREDIVALAGPDCQPPLPPIIIDEATWNLKNFKDGSAVSQETNAFNADVFFKGKKIAYAFNEGTGGGTAVQCYGVENKEKFQEMEQWAAALPPSSSSDRIYRAILQVATDYKDGVPEGERIFLTTSGVDLDELADAWVSNKLGWKDLGKEIVVGPGGANTTGGIGFLSCKKVVKNNANPTLLNAQQRYSWAVRMRAFFELPLHYYPAPHPFSSGLGRKDYIVHKASGHVGWADYRSTTDDQVGLCLTDWEWNEERTERVYFYPAIKGYREEKEPAEKELIEYYSPSEVEFYSGVLVEA